MNNQDDEPLSIGKDTNEEENSDDPPDGRHIYLPIRIRHNICSYNELDRWLLDYNFHFLPTITLVFWGSVLLLSLI